MNGATRALRRGPWSRPTTRRQQTPDGRRPRAQAGARRASTYRPCHPALLEVVVQDTANLVHEPVEREVAQALVPLRRGRARSHPRDPPADAERQAEAQIARSAGTGRQPVDEGDQRMSLDGVRGQREQRDQRAARLQHARAFPQHVVQESDVLEHLVRVDDVELAVGKRYDALVAHDPDALVEGLAEDRPHRRGERCFTAREVVAVEVVPNSRNWRIRLPSPHPMSSTDKRCPAAIRWMALPCTGSSLNSTIWHPRQRDHVHGMCGPRTLLGRSLARQQGEPRATIPSNRPAVSGQARGAMRAEQSGVCGARDRPRTVSPSAIMPPCPHVELERPPSANADASTVAGFGDEWTRFDQTGLSAEELAELFDKDFHLVRWDDLPAGAQAFDLGCGSGRWARGVAPRVGTLHLSTRAPTPWPWPGGPFVISGTASSTTPRSTRCRSPKARWTSAIRWACCTTCRTRARGCAPA